MSRIFKYCQAHALPGDPFVLNFTFESASSTLPAAWLHYTFALRINDLDTSFFAADLQFIRLGSIREYVKQQAWNRRAIIQELLWR